MNAEFPRLITLLRKEKGISQKQAAAELGISQALLSHYEKGVRECGLDFLIRCSRFYHVSCDYLLGLSPERSGRQLTVEEIPEPENTKDTVFRGNIMPVLNKKLITNSLGIIYDLIGKSESKHHTIIRFLEPVKRSRQTVTQHSYIQTHIMRFQGFPSTLCGSHATHKSCGLCTHTCSYIQSTGFHQSITFIFSDSRHTTGFTIVIAQFQEIEPCQTFHELFLRNHPTARN